MKRMLISFFFTSLLVFLYPAAPVSAAEGGSLIGTVTVDLNVTIVNTAPFPKFIVLNPAYNVTVYRVDNTETNLGFYIDPRMSLNYNPGIWLLPYETVVVNFQFTKLDSYALPTQNCGGEDGTYLSCGTVGPVLINSPTQLSADSMFPILDKYVKILSYEATVHFTVSSSDEGVFRKFFALTLPIIFTDGNMDYLYPNYTMTYGEYVKTVMEYKGLETISKTQPPAVSMPSNMFQLTDKLLTGVEVKPPEISVPKVSNSDIPVWIVMTSSGIDITYHVSWKNEGR